MTNDLTKSHYVENEDIHITPRGRTNFVQLARKFINKRGAGKTDAGKDDGQYALSICFPPTVDLKPLKLAVNKVAKDKFGADLFTPGKSKGVKSPFLSAAEKDVVFIDPATNEPMDLTGWTMIRANSKKRQPVVRNARGEVVPVEELDTEAYSGRWMRMMIRPADYDVDGGKGVKFYLEGVQLLKHDEPVGAGGGTTGQAFGAVDDEDEGGVDPLS